MTVGELIEELSRYPRHVPVKVLTCTVLMPSYQYNGEENWRNPYEVDLDPTDAIEADVVIYEGTHVLIESK